MREKYRERPKQPLCEQSEVKRDTAKKRMRNKQKKFSWPLSDESQMWKQVRCCVCDRPAQWVGVSQSIWADMLGDNETYFWAEDAWCYFCFPRENFTEEELRLVRHAEWARKQAVNDIVEIIRDIQLEYDEPLVESVLSKSRDRIIAEFKSPEERMQEWKQWMQSFSGAATQDHA